MVKKYQLRLFSTLATGCLLFTAACGDSQTAHTPSQIAQPTVISTTQQLAPTVPVEATPPPKPTQALSPTADEPTPTPQLVEQSKRIILSRGKTVELISPDGSITNLPVLGLKKSKYVQIVVSNGAWIAGVTQDDGIEGEELVLYDIKTGRERSLGQFKGLVNNLVFSRDGTSLVFTVVDFSTFTWKVNVLEIVSGKLRVLFEGNDTNREMYVPHAWTQLGIIATQYWAFGADAGEEGIYLIDPENSMVRTVRPPDTPYIALLVSPDGQQIAIEEGLAGVGIENPSSSLVIQDLQSGEKKMLEPERQGHFWPTSWSPDSSKLLYTYPPSSDARDKMYGFVDLVSGDRSVVDFSSIPGIYSDITLRSNDTLLLLADEGDREKLYEVRINAREIRDVKQLLSRNLPENSILSTMIYVGE